MAACTSTQVSLLLLTEQKGDHQGVIHGDSALTTAASRRAYRAEFPRLKECWKKARVLSKATAYTSIIGTVDADEPRCEGQLKANECHVLPNL